MLNVNIDEKEGMKKREQKTCLWFQEILWIIKRQLRDAKTDSFLWCSKNTKIIHKDLKKIRKEISFSH
jgi:hypothetical protein